MAGKGDKPRKVDGNKYRDNFDKIFRQSQEKEDLTKRTWEEWAEIKGDWIKSPDGFRGDPKGYKYYESEYIEKRGYCTTYFCRDIWEAIKNQVY